MKQLTLTKDVPRNDTVYISFRSYEFLSPVSKTKLYLGAFQNFKSSEKLHLPNIN